MQTYHDKIVFEIYNGFLTNDDEQGNVEAIPTLSFYYILQHKCIRSHIRNNSNSYIADKTII